MTWSGIVTVSPTTSISGCLASLVVVDSGLWSVRWLPPSPPSVPARPDGSLAAAVAAACDDDAASLPSPSSRPAPSSSTSEMASSRPLPLSADFAGGRAAWLAPVELGVMPGVGAWPAGVDAALPTWPPAPADDDELAGAGSTTR